MARIRADKLLVERGFFESRAQAQAAIEAGLVSANGVPVRKASEGVEADADIAATPAHPWVSRGGVKLAAALDAFGIDPAGLACLDVGASTGGFTDVLLARGAAQVLAVDVGQGQLHPRLKADPRVISWEKVDARSLVPQELPLVPALVVADLSFVPLAKVLPAVLPLAPALGRLVALVKPQFEAGRAHVGRGGIVRDEAVQARAVQEVADLLTEAGWRVLGTIPSPIAGGDGNREFLIGAERV